MSNPPRRRVRRRIHPIVKFIFSLAAIALMLYVATFAFRYCMGLFMVGEDYVVQIPGQDSPIVEYIPEEETVSPADPIQITETSRATVLAAGDLMTHLPIVRSGKTGNSYDFSSIFRHVEPYVAAADYAIVNLETTLSGTSGKEYTGYPKFNAPDAFATGAYGSGFDLALFANNHCNDYGTSGMLRTLETLQGAGLETLGVTTTAEAQKYTIKNLNNIHVGMINYTFADIGADRNTPAINGIPTDSAASGLINAFDYDNLDMFYAEMEVHIASMKENGAEAIVLFIHWGDEYTISVNDKQKSMAQKLCELGVDVIVGSHPHVVQTVDFLTSNDGSHHTVCAYSLGNFLSNQRATNIDMTTGHTEDSLLFSFTFVKYSNGKVHLESVDLMPTWVLVRGTGDGRTYHILPLDEAVEDWAAAYELNSTQLSEAQQSKVRTQRILDQDWNALRIALDQLNYNRGLEYGTISGGVG